MISPDHNHPEVVCAGAGLLARSKTPEASTQTTGHWLVRLPIRPLFAGSSASAL